MLEGRVGTRRVCQPARLCPAFSKGKSRHIPCTLENFRVFYLVNIPPGPGSSPAKRLKTGPGIPAREGLDFQKWAAREQVTCSSSYRRRNPVLGTWNASTRSQSLQEFPGSMCRVHLGHWWKAPFPSVKIFPPLKRPAGVEQDPPS